MRTLAWLTITVAAGVAVASATAAADVAPRRPAPAPRPTTSPVLPVPVPPADAGAADASRIPTPDPGSPDAGPAPDLDPSSVVIGPARTVAGVWRSDDDATFRRGRVAYRKCWSEALALDPNHAGGTLSLTLSFPARGREVLHRIDPADTTLADPTLATCVIRRVHRLLFDNAVHPDAPAATYTLTFEKKVASPQPKE